MKRMAVVLGIVGVILTALFIAGAYAQGPTPSTPPLTQQGQITISGDALNFQGQLYDKNTGSPVQPGNYDMRFTICEDSGCNTVSWGPFAGTVAVAEQGLFSALLGNGNGGIGNSLTASNFTGDRWLKVEVWGSSGWDWMDPNQPLTGAAVSIGNIRKNVVDESRAFSNLSILSVINEANGRGITGESETGIGVIGISHTSVGVWGEGMTGTDGAAVMGVNRNTAANVYGVLGVAGNEWWRPNDKHAGVIGSVLSAGGIGVFGINPPEHNGLGVVGITDSTVYYVPPDGSVGLLAQGDYGVYASANDSTNGWAGVFYGKLYVSQPLYAGGPHFSMADTSQGQRALAAIESPAVWFEDFGRANLSSGQVTVTIDALFAETVNLTQDYHVFLTPLGDCKGLYVAAMTPASFEVRELSGGTASIAFDYRIVARKLGWEAMRMPLFTGGGNRVQLSIEESTPVEP